MSIAHHHIEWLSLLDISGPFLSLPVLVEALPQGLEAIEPGKLQRLRAAYHEWQDNQQGVRADPAIHRAWVEWVLNELLEFDTLHPANCANGVLRPICDEMPTLASEPATPLRVTMAEHGETLSADWLIAHPSLKASNGSPAVRLLVQMVPPTQELDKPLAGSRWQASLASRMVDLLRGSGVRLGLLTNGERWMLVDAAPGQTSAFVSWYGQLWLDEPLTVRAFVTLLRKQRFFGRPQNETIEALLSQSASNQQDVTDQLGLQVRHAVELLVQAIDRADQEQAGALLTGIPESELYQAAVTVMMRLVFLLSAEERGLLPLNDPIYGQHYAVATLQEQLRTVADQQGEEVLEYRSDAWQRLLATFRAVHGGIYHDRLLLTAYGGGLFDPGRFPFLEGSKADKATRRQGEGEITDSALRIPHSALHIDNRTVLHLLEALQYLRTSLPGGGGSERRRLSFRALDIEQIGHVYEGLLDHTARRTTETVLGLVGSKDREPEVSLAKLESYLSQRADSQFAIHNSQLLTFLKEETNRSESTLQKALAAKAPEESEKARLLSACNNNPELLQRILPWHGLIRRDDYERPVIINAGSVYVTAGSERRATGTHYTPRSLTEPIVQHTLEPLVYCGPAEGKPRSEWQLRTSEALLALKICDMAMGSGAFLVQVCRYLSERLVEAWEEELQIANGELRKDGKRGRTIATRHSPFATEMDAEERLTLARRLIADRCLYGVDKNPLAVEMAKLSLWLVTMDQGKPFTFLDHALKCGDSLVGVTLDQLRCWNLEGSGQRQFGTLTIENDIQRMIALRREIETLPMLDIRDQQVKAWKLAQAEAIAHDLKSAGNMLIASYYNQLSKQEQFTLRSALLSAARDGADVEARWLQHADLGDLQPFHWELEFPEVFVGADSIAHNPNKANPAITRRGFDGFIGNPPFVGGRRIRETLGDNYRVMLDNLYFGSSGNADLSAFFFLRCFDNLQKGGALGLIATNTIAQGDTRQTGLQKIESEEGTIYHAVNNMPWPGTAAVVVNIVHIAKGEIKGQRMLDNRTVSFISSQLDSQKVIGDPIPLIQNSGKSFQGSLTRGMGFVITQEEAKKLIDADPRNKTVVQPYLNGEDLNSSPDQSPSRWVINFGTLSLAEAERYVAPMKILRERVYPERMNTTENRATYEKMWWQFWRPRAELYATITPMHRVLVVARVSKTVAFSFVPKGWVYNEKVVAFAFENAVYFAILQSSLHYHWAWQYSSTLKSDLNYAPSDCFDNFPFPQSPITNIQSLSPLGESYHETRCKIMLTRQEGLTTTYNRFHKPQETAADIVELRRLHVEMDNAVAAAYGWCDLALGHGFHETAQGTRYTIHESARREVLSRLLALNHERYEAEVKDGLHEKKKKVGKGVGEKGREGQLGFELG